MLGEQRRLEPGGEVWPGVAPARLEVSPRVTVDDRPAPYQHTFEPHCPLLAGLTEPVGPGAQLDAGVEPDSRGGRREGHAADTTPAELAGWLRSRAPGGSEDDGT
jgi:hypothetical protein